jgi:DNA polymerase-3 subunit epsilon
LPLYTAHDGLIDAIACGELLLAQRARKGAGEVKIADMLRR